MAQAIWTLNGSNQTNKTSNVTITITDNAGVVEGKEVVATCNGKSFTSLMKRGICKIYSTEVGTYTISVGEYSTMLVCPYYGQFSTDIYSGILKVVCMEVGGNNKTCHVQSCDDNYEFTDDYNLTQTFDDSLELTFMGIPTGKYLITVDDKYRFYKEIMSIQNINSVEVELKQWLFNNGSQCEWNTGGWMQCQATGSINTVYASGSQKNPSIATHKEELQYTDNALRLYQRCTAIEIKYPSAAQYARSDATSSIYTGTKKTLPFSASKYTSLNYVSDKPVTMTLRNGALNNSSTNTSTATVLTSGTATSMYINAPEADVSLILGSTFNSTRGYGSFSSTSQYNGGIKKSPQGNIDETKITNITQVYLA